MQTDKKTGAGRVMRTQPLMRQRGMQADIEMFMLTKSRHG